MLLLLQERPGSQPGHAAAERGAHGFPGRAVRGVVVDGAAAGGRSRWGLAWGVGRPHGSLLLCRWPITPLVCVMCAARLRRGLCCREGVPCGVLLQSAGPPQSAALGASSTRADHVRGACRLGANAEHRRGRGGGGAKVLVPAACGCQHSQRRCHRLCAPHSWEAEPAAPPRPRPSPARCALQEPCLAFVKFSISKLDLGLAGGQQASTGARVGSVTQLRRLLRGSATADKVGLRAPRGSRGESAVECCAGRL